jgi:hypothetical protein
MRVLIHHPFIKARAVPITYDNIYNSGGFSGTETAIVEVSKYIMTMYNEVLIDVIGLTTSTYKDNGSGIMFYAYKDFVDCGMMNHKYDWYIPIFCWYEPFHQMLLSHYSTKKPRPRLLFWMQSCIQDNIIDWHKTKGFDVYSMFVSEWVRKKYSNVFDDNHMCMVPNGISPHRFLVFSRDIRKRWRSCRPRFQNDVGDHALRRDQTASNVLPRDRQK